MKTKWLLLILSVSIMAISFAMRPAVQPYPEDQVILKITSLNAIQKGYTSGDTTVRGLYGSGLPWTIGSAQGRLTASGKIYLMVTGMVYDPQDPMVIAKGLENQNNVPSFRMTVSCRTINWGIVNTQTELFPVTTGLASQGGGNARIETQVSIPQPCMDPVLFITGPSGAWFAATPF